MKMISLTKAARERGISLIEGVLYLVIALSVIVGGVVFFQQAQLSSSVTDTARAGAGISSETRALYQNQRSFGTGDITEALLAAGAVPSNFQNGTGDAITHPFGGSVTVTGDTEGFSLEMTDVTEAACLRLGSVSDTGQGSMGTGITGVDIVSGTGTPATASPDNLPVDASNLASDCDPAGSNMTFFYAR